MTNTYRTTGTLTNPVNDLAAARAYLVEHDMTEYIDDFLKDAIHDVRWDLTDESSWTVTVVTNRPLTAEESASFSSWISGQNSDGLGEGFEQQPFAEETAYEDVEDEEFYRMSSFDWETNDCALTLVK